MFHDALEAPLDSLIALGWVEVGGVLRVVGGRVWCKWAEQVNIAQTKPHKVEKPSTCPFNKLLSLFTRGQQTAHATSYQVAWLHPHCVLPAGTETIMLKEKSTVSFSCSRQPERK